MFIFNVEQSIQSEYMLAVHKLALKRNCRFILLFKISNIYASVYLRVSLKALSFANVKRCFKIRQIGSVGNNVVATTYTRMRIRGKRQCRVKSEW